MVGDWHHRRVDVSGALPIETADTFDAWLRAHGGEERSIVVSILKQSTGRQTVTLPDLQAVAVCHGWVDTLTQRIDDERYAIRFVPRRPGSAWGESNRELARRMLAEGRMTDAGRATLPPDL